MMLVVELNPFCLWRYGRTLPQDLTSWMSERYSHLWAIDETGSVTRLENGSHADSVEVLMMGPSSAGLSNEQIAFARATGLTRMHAGGGDATENITVHEVPVSDAARWLTQKAAEGYSMDPKLWAGLWLLDRNPDGTPV